MIRSSSSTSVLGVPEVQGDELDSVHFPNSLQPGSDRGLVQVDLVDVEAWLANLQHRGRNLLDSGLREETVHVEHQQDVLTAWLGDTHNQLVGVDFKGDTEAVSRESEDSVRADELPGTRIEDPEPHLVEEERRRIVDQDLSGETERRELSTKISEISSSRELGPVQFPQSLGPTVR